VADMTELSQQFLAFGLTIALGILMGVFFDFYRVLNRLLHPPRLVIQVGDLLFWLVLTGVVFTILFLGNWGEVRAYVFLGLALGLVIYFKWFSRLFIRLFNRVLRLVGRVLRFVGQIVGWPIRRLAWLARLMIIPVGRFSNGFRTFLTPVRRAARVCRRVVKKLIPDKK